MQNQSENINELASALAKCQGEMSFAVKDSKNPHFGNKYADLASVWDAIRAPLAKNGLCIVQAMDEQNNKVILITTLLHSSGQWMRSILPIKTDKDTCQGWGSGITYSRRYALAALVGCVQDDDDGNAAESPAVPKQKSKPQKSNGPLINIERASQLLELKDMCEPSYVVKVMTYLESMDIKTFNQIPEALFERIYSGMQKNIELVRSKDV